MESHPDEFGEAFHRATALARRVREAWLELSDTEQAVVMSLLELKFRAPQQYAVFVLRSIRGLVPDQIATLLAISRDAVYQHHHRAKRTLAENLAAYEEIQAWLRATGRRPTAGRGASTEDEGGAD